jgi:hypothetical protein
MIDAVLDLTPSQVAVLGDRLQRCRARELAELAVVQHTGDPQKLVQEYQAMAHPGAHKRRDGRAGMIELARVLGDDAAAQEMQDIKVAEDIMAHIRGARA